MFSLIVLHF